MLSVAPLGATPPTERCSAFHFPGSDVPLPPTHVRSRERGALGPRPRSLSGRSAGPAIVLAMRGCRPLLVATAKLANRHGVTVRTRRGATGRRRLKADCDADRDVVAGNLADSRAVAVAQPSPRGCARLPDAQGVGRRRPPSRTDGRSASAAGPPRLAADDGRRPRPELGEVDRPTRPLAPLGARAAHAAAARRARQRRHALALGVAQGTPRPADDLPCRGRRLPQGRQRARRPTARADVHPLRPTRTALLGCTGPVSGSSPERPSAVRRHQKAHSHPQSPRSRAGHSPAALHPHVAERTWVVARSRCSPL